MVKNVHKALESETLNQSLTTIVNQYSSLAELFGDETGISFSIGRAEEVFKNLDFGADDCKIKGYLQDRIDKNAIAQIWKGNNTTLTPSEYAMLSKCQATTVAVERSFSLLNKLLAKDRNFNPNNVEFYMVAKYNSFML